VSWGTIGTYLTFVACTYHPIVNFSTLGGGA
jgi:hypothetical protein